MVNRAANAFPMAAFSLTHSRSALGAFYRRLRSRLGAPKAMTATAHKLARTLMLKKLQKKAQALGLELVPKSTLPACVS